MQIKTRYTALAACALLMIPASVFADNESAQDQTIPQSYLNAELARITCQANHEIGYMNTVIADIPNINQTTISGDSSKIGADLKTLATDVTDKHQFKTDLKSFRIDSTTWTHDLRFTIKNAHPSSDEKAKMKSDLGNLRSSYKTCNFSAEQQFASARIHAYGMAIQKVQNKTKIIGSKGIDTTQLNHLINEAQTNLDNLESSISYATNSSQLKTVMKSYCQYNGCKNGINFHFAAQNALDSEQAALDSIKSNPDSGQYSSKMDQAKTDLTNAQNMLNVIGTNKYQGSQQTDIWNAIRDAHDIIKQLWGELNGHKITSTSSNFGSSQ